MEDGYGAGLDGMGPGFEHDFYGDMDQDMSTTQLNVEYDPNDKENDREERKYQQIVKRFRVIMPADIDKMLEDSQNKQTGDRERITP